MKKALLLFLSFVLSSSLVEAAETFGNLHSVEYLKTISGDSFLANIHGQHPLIGEKIEIRLKGILTPKQKGVCAKERERAKKTIELVDFMLSRAKKITLKNVERGRRFRLVATVLADGKDLRDVLIKKGYAVKITSGQRTFNWCR